MTSIAIQPRKQFEVSATAYPADEACPNSFCSLRIRTEGGNLAIHFSPNNIDWVRELIVQATLLEQQLTAMTELARSTAQS